MNVDYSPESVFVFIDEFATPDIEVSKVGNEPLFIYAAVVIKAVDIESARTVLNGLYDKYYKNRYIKSTRIGNDANGFTRTINTLTDLKSLKHYVRALVVDKSKIDAEGLSYKQSFIKFFQQILFKKLLETHSEVHVIFDKTGDDIFAESLKLYMEKNLGFGQNLFSNNTFEAKDDEEEEKLLQLADFYAGTIGKYYCGHYDTNKADVIHNTFMKSRLSIEWFPREYTSLIAASASFDGGFDIELLKIATDTAADYLETSDDTVGCELVSYLLQESYRNPNRYISSKEIKANLMSREIEIGDPINKISELRDKGVLIISPIGKKGYKFPTSELEIAEFFNRLSGNVVPQLRRGFIMNKLFREKSVGRIDVLGKPEFDLLRSLGEKSTDSRNIQ